MAFRIEYKESNSGWIKITLHGENDSLDINISEVYDPFEDWFYALEKIYRSDPPSIIINPEGNTYRIDILFQTSTFNYCFRVINHVNNNEVFSCITTREEIIEQMYGKLMEFIRSDKYNQDEYETYPNSTGYSLKKYSNETLERYLEGKAFDDSI